MLTGKERTGQGVSLLDGSRGVVGLTLESNHALEGCTFGDSDRRIL